MRKDNTYLQIHLLVDKNVDINIKMTYSLNHLHVMVILNNNAISRIKINLNTGYMFLDILSKAIIIIYFGIYEYSESRVNVPA